MADRYPEAEVVLDDELLFEEGPRRSGLTRRDDRAEDIVREGEVLAGKYRVERIPGRNGLGVLVQVRHLELGQQVTLKFLVPEACAYPEFVQRFVREARAAVRIQGEHVARVTDVGRLESGAPYMVREYLRGPDLAEVLKVRGPLPVSEAVDYIVQACEGVAEGHALGVVHRNLRPTSLVVARRSDGTPLVKVFDFAAAESLHVNPFTERAVSLVGTSAIMSSLPYLAPEQIRDPQDVDFRADVYSLGAILYELLTATPVYAGDAAPALLAKVAADAAPALRTLRSDIPGELDHIVLRCLAKNRAIRYASVAELVLALQAFASLDSLSSIERIVRLANRTSKVTDSNERDRRAASLPPTSVVVPPPSPAPRRGQNGTVVMRAIDPPPAGRSPSHEDVTTINPYSAYAAPVVISSTPPRREVSAPPTRSEPAARPVMRTQPLPSVVVNDGIADSELDPAPVRHTPPPPPLRTSVPPPLRASGPPPLRASGPPPLRASASVSSSPSEMAEPERRPDTTALPPSPRTSVPPMTRSWAAYDTAPPRFTPKWLLGFGLIAACASLGAVMGFRAGTAGSNVQPVAAARIEPVSTPVVPLAPAAPVAALPAAPVAAALPPAGPATVAPALPATPALAVAQPPAAVPVGQVPAPTAAPVAPVAAVLPAAAPVAQPAAVALQLQPIARRPAAKPREETPVEKPRKADAAIDQKVASTRPASGGDLFDDPR